MTVEGRQVHLIAICGMGMGSLAGLLQGRGFRVRGSDQNVYPPMSDQLARLGVEIRVGYRAANLEPRPDLVVVGNAVPKTNPEVEALLRSGLPYLSMPQALEDFFLKDREPIVVAGTHGKTTTSALLAWLLEDLGWSPGFLVGGILRNLDCSSEVGTGRHFVVEGDEYDSAFFDKGPKFLHYHPKILVLNPIEFDHADIYRDLSHLMEAFEKLVETLPRDAVVVAQAGNGNVRDLLPCVAARKITFGMTDRVDYRADSIRLGPLTCFRLLKSGKPAGEITSPLLGSHNIENLLAAIAVCDELGIPLEKVQESILRFQGIKRRQEVLGSFRGVTLVDDFAHHPTAVRETLKALKGRFPASRLWALFEPRSNTTRRNVFQTEFPEALAEADRVIVGGVYQPDRIPTPERLDPDRVVKELNVKGVQACYLEDPSEICATVVGEAKPGDVVCLLTNGNFGGLAQKLTTAWS